MTSSTSPFQFDDQTDEDFFDKLVDDEFDGSQSKPEEISRVLANLSLDDSLDDSAVPVFADKVETVKKVDVLKPAETQKEVSDGGPPLETSSSFDPDKIDVGKSDGSKGTNVKVVQWSAFTVDSSQELEKVDGFQPYSDFLTDNSDGLFGNPVDDFSSNVDFTEQHDTLLSGMANGHTVDENDPKYWESVYQGWKFDQGAGQWYQVDGYDARTDAQLDNSSVASMDSVSKSLDVSYLQQASQAALETIAEDCTVSSVSNYNTQVGMEYPSNMAFDPQYPGWYYDTNTQQWYTVESYTHELANNSTSNAVQDQLPEGMNASTVLSSEQDHNLYSNIEPSQQHGTQGEGSQEFGHAWNSDIDNYAPQTRLYGNVDQSAQQANQSQYSQDFGQSWDASTSNHDQKNIIYSTTTESEQTISQGSRSQVSVQNWSPATSNHSQPNSLYSPTVHHGGQVQGSHDFGESRQASMSNYSQQNNLYNNLGQSEHHVNQSQGSQGFRGHSDASKSTHAVQNMWQPQSVGSNELTTGFSGNQQARSFYGTIPGAQTTLQTGFKAFEPVVKQNYDSSNGPGGLHSFAPAESTHNFYQPKVEQPLQAHLSNSYYGDQNAVPYSQQSFQGPNSYQFPYAPSEGRSSAGRPSHALVAFGFGGKLIVMKNVNSFGTTLDYGSQENASGAISVLSLSEVVKDKADASFVITGRSHGYFHALCQPSFHGPLVGGSAAAKDVNKWIDEKIVHCESTSMDARKGEFLKLLLSLLKIMCQHYGKLRSPFGADSSLEEMDGPESVVTKLLASARNNSARLTELGSLTHCMQNLPSEGQIRATAIEVQNLLVSGRRKEALQYAQEGQLWGPALVLATQFGEKFYVETVKKMAQCQFVSGSPLRTLCLLIAGQPADVFAADSSPKFSAPNGPQGPTQVLANGMLDDWEKNLAIITANRTKDDELVIIHIGDCLLKERGEIIAAHICYLVAEANFESYSDSARLCLIGADHWKSPRTFASPEAIQRTEVYEYSKVLGNSQFILLPFQPYKLIYAYMLAEVGKVSDSLRYCQASLKLLKNSSRAPEVETWKTLFSSLEERLRTHQQGGYSSNLAPAKLVGALFTSIDRSIHRMIGAPPAALPPLPPSSAMVPKVAASSQSTMAMSSLIPSASVEAISEWSDDGGKKAMHNRSISEPDFGKSPKVTGSTDGQRKSSGVPSRFGLIGSHLLQKTIGWVSRSHVDHQAKLGESNKFYYDEKLKRWVEEGAEPPAEEAALPPPPTAVATLKDQSPPSNGGPVPLEPSSGIPPVPPSQNQFSARARMGVRSRYVDTFNKGASGGTGGMRTTSFQSPPAPPSKPAIGAKFFVPATPAPSDAPEEPIQEPTTHAEPSTSLAKEAHLSSLQRFSSMDSISPSSNNGNGSFSRARASSWSGTYSGAGGSPPQILPQDPPSGEVINGGPIHGDELHEVEL